MENQTRSDSKKSDNSVLEKSIQKKEKKVIEEKDNSLKLTGALAKYLLKGKYPGKWVRPKLQLNSGDSYS